MAYDKVVDSAVLEAGLKKVGDSIRAKAGTSALLEFPDAMAAAVDGIAANPVIQALTVTENGTYTAPDGVDGYSPVVVEVPSWIGISYTGDFTDARDADGKGDVTFHTSGTFIPLGADATIVAYILGGGGGAARAHQGTAQVYAAPGGGGGQQTISVDIKKKETYEIVIGAGGALAKGTGTRTGATGGTTEAFGAICTGGQGGVARYSTILTPGEGGTPNGNAGSGNDGGSPNGGSVSGSGSSTEVTAGSAGLVRITFS